MAAGSCKSWLCLAWRSISVREGYLCGGVSLPATPRQLAVLAAYVAAAGFVAKAAALFGVRPSIVKRHLADLRARTGLTTETLIYAGRAAGWLVVPSLEPRGANQARRDSTRHQESEPTSESNDSPAVGGTS